MASISPRSNAQLEAAAALLGSAERLEYTLVGDTVNLCQRLQQLADKGEVVRGFIGITMDELPRDRARQLGLAETGGVLVKDVLQGQSARKAGIQAGDVITRYKQESLGLIHPVRQLRQWILDTEPGTQVAMELLRDGARQVVQVQIGKRPGRLP